MALQDNHDRSNDLDTIQVMKETMKVLQEKIAMLEIAKDLPSTKKALSEDEDSVTAINNSDACPEKDSGSAVTPSDGESDTAKLPPEKPPRARIVINKIDPESGQRSDHLPSDSQTKPPVTEVSHAFTLRRSLYDDKDENDGEIEIADQALWDLLGTILQDYPNHTFTSSMSTIHSPYEVLIFNWDKLEAATKEEPTTQAQSDLKLLLDAIMMDSGDPKLDKYFKTRLSNRDQGVVTFETLFTLFPPGTLIYGRPFLGQDQVLLMWDNMSSWPVTRSGKLWTMLCWTYDWDGKVFKRMPLRIDIDHFEGAKRITTLPFYPLEYHPQCQQIKEAMIARGKRYRDYCGQKPGSQMFDYDGEAVPAKKGFSRLDDDEEDDGSSHLDISDSTAGMDTKPIKLDSGTRVMVDFVSWFRYGPADARVGPLRVSSYQQCDCQLCRVSEACRVIYRRDFDLENHRNGLWVDEQYLLCPPRILGYVLKDKQWAQLLVDGIKQIEIPRADSSWTRRLQLADGNETKSLIYDLVKSHTPSEPGRSLEGLEVEDIVAKKGKGLVILLHGPPGVGKTSTAETVAVATQKPLFSVSVADVGTNPNRVEARLEKLFALATSWEAILLLDEADVFLERRGGPKARTSTDKNALVSVFLRVLEYYQGILFLTTNQIAQFDVAVQSRIHIAIKYDHLNKDQTMAIFKGFLEPIANKGLIHDWEDICSWLNDDISGEGLDGRQIRNIVTSALGLARAQKCPKLTKAHIRRIFNNTKKFKNEFRTQYEKYKNEQQGMLG